MIRSLFTAATGMSAQQFDQDVVANNLANVNTVGFKKSRANFQDLMYQIYSKAGATSATGVQLPSGIEVGMGVKPISTQKIFSQGDYQQTGNAAGLGDRGRRLFPDRRWQRRDRLQRAGNFKIEQGFEHLQFRRTAV